MTFYTFYYGFNFMWKAALHHYNYSYSRMSFHVGVHMINIILLRCGNHELNNINLPKVKVGELQSNSDVICYKLLKISQG